MKSYCADDFFETSKTENICDLVDRKISLLRDFVILPSHTTKRELELRELLMQCKTESEMTIMLHDVLRGECTVVELLQRKGVR